MAMKDFTINDLSGGMNDADPPTSLLPNQCTVAENIDFFKSPCGARRKGCSNVTLPASISGKLTVSHVFRHLPTSNETEAQLWVYAFTINTSFQLAYKDTSWHDVAMADAPMNDINDLQMFQHNMQTLHGKLFFAYKTAAVNDRLHVWDGTTLRRVGLVPPAAAPTAANSGVGTFVGTRYYRTREIVRDSTGTILRSEPTTSLSFAPSGTGSGATVTKPTTINSNATHWELEASLNNADFYRIDTVVIGTTTSVDTATTALGYTSFTLSEDIGDYTVPGSGRFLLADEDRLLIGGSFENHAEASTVRWTPVFLDPGVGNDERIPLDTDNALSLDGFEGGGLTGLAGPLYGQVYAFKRSHIYKLIRTGQRQGAYRAVCISKSVGAIAGSILEAVDEAGRPALYFLDPKVGPMRLGEGGLLQVGQDILGTWATVNNSTTTGLTARCIYNPNKNQVHWWIAIQPNDQVSHRITLQLDATVSTPKGVRLGWTKHTGISARAFYACLFATNINDGVARSIELKPFIALGNNPVVLMMEDGNTDNGDAYTGTLITRPFMLSGSINNKFGIRAGHVVGAADATATVDFSLIRDFGIETSPTNTLSMAPAGAEDPVIVRSDDLRLAEMRAVQIKLVDGVGNTGQWAIHRIDLVPRSEETS